VPHVQTTSGSGAAALGIIGTGLALALPDDKWIGWILVAAGLLVFLFDVRIEGWHVRAGRLRDTRLNTWGPWVLIIGGPVLGFAWLYLGPTARPTGDPGPISWELNNPPIGGGRFRGEPSLKITNFAVNGTSMSDEPLIGLRVYVRSDINPNKIMELEFSGEHGGIPAEKAIIAPRAKFNVGAYFPSQPVNEGLTTDEFRNQFGKFSFVVERDGKRFFTKSFSENEIDARILEIDRMTRRPLPSGVVIKDDK
jgi:hypothetical protein